MTAQIAEKLRYEGYALLRGDTVGPYMLTKRK